MKLLIVAAVVIFGVVSAQDPKYTTKYDGVNLDEILKSDRLLNNYFKCLMETGKCTPDGNELKRTLPDALRTDCGKCKSRLSYWNLQKTNVEYFQVAKNKRLEPKKLSTIWSTTRKRIGKNSRRNTTQRTSTTPSSRQKPSLAESPFKNFLTIDS